MRPFRFFFTLSLGIILFFFVARFVIIALIAAAILSGVFFFIRRAKYYFYHMREGPYHYQDYGRDLDYQHRLPQADPDDVPFYDYERSPLPDREWRTIKIQ